ncbi:MAG: YbhN family protein [bacterium]
MLTKKAFGLFILFGCFLGYLVHLTADSNTWQMLSEVNCFYLLLALFSLFLGWYFDAYRVGILASALKKELSLSVCWQVVLSNYFLGIFTPASSGGLVGQVYCLTHSGLELGKSMALVILRTLLSILCLVIVSPAVIYFDPFLFQLRPEFYLALVFMLFCLVGLIFILVKSENPLFNRFKVLAALRNLISEITQSLLLYKNTGWRSLVKSFFYSAVSLFFLYLSVPFLILAFDLYPSFLSVLGRVALVNLLLYFAPTPGGTGVAEGGMTLALQGLVPFQLTGIISILWRFLSEYLPCLMGAVICFPILQKKLHRGR